MPPTTRSQMSNDMAGELNGGNANTTLEGDGAAENTNVTQVAVDAASLDIVLSATTSLKKAVEEIRLESRQSIQEIRTVVDNLPNVTATAPAALNFSPANVSTPILQNVVSTSHSAPEHTERPSNAAVSFAPMFDQAQGPHEDLLFPFSPPQACRNVQRQDTNAHYVHKLHALPIFDGKPEEWPLFVTAFNGSTEEFGYNNNQNLIRLHKALQGEAKRAVTALLIFPDDVPNAIQELQFNFGRPELLVNSQERIFRDFPVITESRMEPILALSNQVRNMVALFKSAKCEHHLMNSTLLEVLTSKLPPSKRYEWAKHSISITPFPTIESFSVWLQELARYISVMSPNVVLNTRNSVNNRPAQPNVRRVLHSNDKNTNYPKNNCLLCGSGHTLIECTKYLSLSTEDKWKNVKSLGVCFGCLKKGHNLFSCRTKRACSENGCSKYHHPTLHNFDTSNTNSAIQTQTSLPKLPLKDDRVLNCRQDNNTQLFKIVPITLSGPHGSLAVFAMLDEGSSITILHENIAVALGLKGHTTSLTLQWYGNEQKREKSTKVTLSIKGQHEDAMEYCLKNVYTVSNLNLPCQSFDKSAHKNFDDLPIMNYKNATPVLLIGLDNSFLSVYDEIFESDPQQPIAVKTKLGWIAYGPVKSDKETIATVMHIRSARGLDEINRMVSEYFTVENFGVRKTNTALDSDDNHRARKILEDTTKKISHGRYETGLIWKSQDIKLPNSYEMAKQRLLKVENRMQRDSVYGNRYKAEIEKYITNGYARQLTSEEVPTENEIVWYLPHFGVSNPNKPDKLRIVYDAAARVQEYSLNSVLLKGPEHAKPLLEILFKFRQGKVAVAGDIKEMFSQVYIRKADQQAQRFLWRDGDPNKPIGIYIMNSMIFGAICSPCSAEYVKNLNADKLQQLMPRGAKVVKEKTYVDDVVASFDSEKEAEEVIREAIIINSEAGFLLRQFVSNFPKLQSMLNGEESRNEVINLERGIKTDKILGLFWNTQNDTLEYHFQFHKVPPDVLKLERAPTKREMLGLVMAIYDPFGLLANYTISSKLLFQATWKNEIQWDDPLPNYLFVQWCNWWREFQTVKQLAVPRCYSLLLQTAEKRELHIFVDASCRAYASVAYLR